MKIAVDAMGGDFAPLEVVRGAVAAARAGEAEILLVGEPGAIEAVGAEAGLPCPGVEVVAARERVAMGEHPAEALRHKKDSSLAVGARLVKEGRAGALVSAGNTGAAMAFSLFTLGRLPGVERPAIAAPFPTTRGFAVLIDAGANVEVKPHYLLQFAQMGSLYAASVLKRAHPRVGLLNVGAESGKGTPVLQEACRLLTASGLNFIGNIEGRDVPLGAADVIVCDGFSGNVLLKFAEGLAEGLFSLLKQELLAGFSTRAGAYLARPALKRLKAKMDYAEYGGAPLLGLKGLTIISHGSSDARAIHNAIRAARESLEQDVVGKIAALAQAAPNDAGSEA
ncbi:MAG: phosphate acyltransferase [Bacillota bacterium]|nr:phosphate acyltransferase [Bacillota bacterium]